MKYFVFSLLASATLLVCCSKDKPTQSQAQQGSLLLEKLVVSMVSGGSDTITVYSRDANGAFSELTVSNGTPSIASVAFTDSVMMITGVSIGTDNVTITNAAGLRCVLPVEVYDKNILDAGEFLIKYTNIYEPYSSGFYPPVPADGFYSLGSMCSMQYPGDSIAMITVKPKPGSDAIAFTDSFISDILYVNRLWMPVPPPGYKAMGYVYKYPGRPSHQACIRENLTTEAEVDEAIFIDNENSWSLWKIEVPICGPHARAYLAPGGFIVEPSIGAPVNHPLANILSVDLQSLAAAPDMNYAPRLTGFSPPPMETTPVRGRALLAPFTVIKDLANGMPWQMNNSQTYRVERQVFYKCLYHNYNQTDVLQTNSYELVSGISTSQSETFRAQVGVSLTTELGVSFSPALTGKIAATVSFELGYERMTGITEFQEAHRITSLNIPPGKAGAIWQRFNRFVVYRHDGTRAEVMGAQDIGVDSYVTDVYPDN